MTTWVKEIDFGLLNVTSFLISIDLTWTIVLTTRQISFISLCFNLNSMQLLCSMQVWIIF